jgi:hypothetical protein
VFWDRLVKNFREGVLRSDGALRIEDADPIPDEEILRHARLRDDRALSRAALSLWMSEKEAARAGMTVDSALFRSTAVRFRRERGLHSAAELARWMRRHSVTEDDFGRIVERDALLTLLGERYEAEVHEHMLDVLKDRGELGRFRDEVRRRRRLGEGGSL